MTGDVDIDLAVVLLMSMTPEERNELVAAALKLSDDLHNAIEALIQEIEQ